jgi:hypothetical protein
MKRDYCGCLTGVCVPGEDVTKRYTLGGTQDQGDAKWIVIGGATIHPAGGQPPAGLSAARGLATCVFWWV